MYVKHEKYRIECVVLPNFQSTFLLLSLPTTFNHFACWYRNMGWRESEEHKLISLLGYGNIIFLLHVIRESIIRSNKCHRKAFSILSLMAKNVELLEMLLVDYRGCFSSSSSSLLFSPHFTSLHVIFSTLSKLIKNLYDFKWNSILIFFLQN